jgi:transcription elongation GreA/GreB family factor
MQLPYRKPTKFSNIPLDPLMTPEKIVELERELDVLKKKKPQAAAEVSRLAEFGDFSENAEYQLAKGRLRGINNAITKLEVQINQAIVIQPEKKGAGVQIGHKVTVEGELGQKRTYQILGSSETDPTKGIISYTSPIGNALLGKKVSDTINIPTGKNITYTIRHIE